jgi:hypothetical protein
VGHLLANVVLQRAKHYTERDTFYFIATSTSLSPRPATIALLASRRLQPAMAAVVGSGASLATDFQPYQPIKKPEYFLLFKHFKMIEDDTYSLLLELLTALLQSPLWNPRPVPPTRLTS